MTAEPAITAQPAGQAWHSKRADEVLAQLGTAPSGLSASEAGKRLYESPDLADELLLQLQFGGGCAVSFALQVWSHHSAFLASFLKTSLMSFDDCLMLLGLSSVPLLVLEVRKVITRRPRSN